MGRSNKRIQKTCDSIVDIPFHDRVEVRVKIWRLNK